MGLNKAPEEDTMNPDPFLYKDTLVWTMTTNGYKYLTLNLIRTIQQAKCPWKLLVVAADRESFTFFGMRVCQCFYIQRRNEHRRLRLVGGEARSFNGII